MALTSSGIVCSNRKVTPYPSTAVGEYPTWERRNHWAPSKITARLISAGGVADNPQTAVIL